MIDSNYMTNSEKLTAFLDGELDAAEAESMFFDMASSPELQEEMRQQIIISKSLKNSLISPPPALKEALFANIGFDGAIATAPAPVVTATFFSRMLNNRVIMVLSSTIVASLITAFFMLYYFNSETEPLLTAAEKPVAELKAINALPASAPIMTSTEAEPAPISQKIFSKGIVGKPKRNAKSSYFAEAISNDKELFATNNSIPVASESKELDEPIDIYYDIEQSRFYSQSGGRMKAINSRKFLRWLEESLSMTEFLNKVSMQIRFSGATSFTDVNVSPLNEPLLNNFAFAVLYDLSSNHSLGFEVGQENFLQKFEGYENAIPTVWHQNYIAFWAGGVYQYNMNEYALIQPYGRVMLGGTRIGPIAKITIGGKYNLTSKISAFAGWENTGLFYEFQNKWFSSYKTGLTAGVAVKF